MLIYFLVVAAPSYNNKRSEYQHISLIGSDVSKKKNLNIFYYTCLNRDVSVINLINSIDTNENNILIISLIFLSTLYNRVYLFI